MSRWVHGPLSGVLVLESLVQIALGFSALNRFKAVPVRFTMSNKSWVSDLWLTTNTFKVQATICLLFMN